jgi:hypothetical protein
MKTWDELKREGSAHYKNGGVEPIDLYRSIGIFRGFALASIIKYASRNVGGGPYESPVSERDMRKIIHYAELLIASCGETLFPPIAKGG